MMALLSVALPQSTTMSNKNNTVASSQQQRQGRIILLLDLDCFYAACERVRLGLPFETCSLALLQWNSVLAVTYPARRQYNIKRGDTWELVHQKSNNHCLALHLPLLEINKTNNGTTGSGGVASSSLDDPDEESATIQSLYQKEYHLTPEERQQVLEQELNKRRFSHEGKACLERYRIASQRIFGVILQTLREKVGEGRFVLERASIDELFMDVTDYCHEQCEKEQNDVMDTNGISEAMQHTVSVGETPNDNNRQDDNHDPEEDHDDKEDNDNLQQALYHGCQIAYTIRQAVYSQLGFTMSAGISVNKLLAKLGASYGKPNGQALIKPSAIPYIMKNTLISKARHFGGKIGKQVENLLPPDAERTMSSIAESLSLPTLTAKLGADTARTVFDACRGVDHEPVKHTVNALVKSITAFKSFQSTCISSGEMHEWLVLLATEIVSRVTHDSHRNSRYPKTCTVQYATDATNRRSQTNKSLRIAFPPETKVESDAVSKLVDKAKEVIAAKEGRNVCLIRVGYCASDFQTRLKNGGISSYFNAAGGESVAVKGDENKSPSRALVEQEDSKPVASFSQQAAKKPPSVLTVDNDLELARKLQASYDRENALLTAAEKRDGSTSAQPKRNKKARIDSFFVKKKS